MVPSTSNYPSVTVFVFCLSFINLVLCFESSLFYFSITGDLTISVNVLYNYLEANNKVPWEDLRYLFGEIMYGGHITDDWDRRLCITYLEELMQPELVSIVINILILSFQLQM